MDRGGAHEAYLSRSVTRYYSNGVVIGMGVDEKKGFRGKERGIPEGNGVTMTTIHRLYTWSCQN